MIHSVERLFQINKDDSVDVIIVSVNISVIGGFKQTCHNRVQSSETRLMHVHIFIFFKVIIKLIKYQFFKQPKYNRKNRDGSKVRTIIMLPLLKIGTTRAVFQLSGNFPSGSEIRAASDLGNGREGSVNQ